MKETTYCCICGNEIYDYGNNPAPVKKRGRCCDKCNASVVIPARLAAAARPPYKTTQLQDYEAKKALIESTLPTLCAAENLFFKSLEYSVQVDNGEAAGETVTLQFDGATVTLDVSKMSIANIAIAVLQRVA